MGVEKEGPNLTSSTNCCRTFTGRFSGRKAQGPDLVTNEFIVYLSDAGRQKLPQMSSMSWARGELPSI